MGMRMCCACPGHMSQASIAADKDTHSVTHFPAVLPSVFSFSLSFHLLVYEGHRGHHHGCSAVPLSGVPVASSTIIAVSGLAGAGAHGQCPSSSGVVDFIHLASAAKSFFGMISLVLVWDKFACALFVVGWGMPLLCI